MQPALKETVTPQRWVPVVSSTGKPLMPCSPARARKLLKAKIDLIDLVEIKPLTFLRRQLRLFNPSKGGKRIRHGGTRSLGYQKGTLVHHIKHGKRLVGGNNGVDRLSLHTVITGSRFCQKAKLEDITKISYSPWRLIDPTTFNREENA